MTDKRDEIIEAALKVFAEHGFHKASIKQIATTAGLSAPSLIYWYFKDKNELFKAVLGHLVPLINLANDGDPSALMELTPEEFFLNIARMYYAALDHPQAAQLMRIFFSEALRSPDVIEYLASGVLPVIGVMRQYLEYQISLGHLRPHDSKISVRAFMGMLLVYMLGTQFFPPFGVGLPDSGHYAE
ncbi:MAG TPA: TetR/AcrR family transcriptional regulator, partial [Phototrophicaceae bacterium]|nr:TetR/AcrR family transcriptional regulator [Phototrophicaceae bacterium]